MAPFGVLLRSSQEPKKWPFECTLKDPKTTLWVYSKRFKKLPFEHMLKDAKNDPLSVCSRTPKMTLLAYAQGPKKWLIEHTFNDQKMTLWAYAQGHLFVVHFNLSTFHRFNSWFTSFLASVRFFVMTILPIFVQYFWPCWLSSFIITRVTHHLVSLNTI